jgi:hypothetical protein
MHGLANEIANVRSEVHPLNGICWPDILHKLLLSFANASADSVLRGQPTLRIAVFGIQTFLLVLLVSSLGICVRQATPEDELVQGACKRRAFREEPETDSGRRQDRMIRHDRQSKVSTAKKH